MERDTLLARVERYYTARFHKHGATARGVDWNGEASQELRFAQLLRVLDGVEPFTLNDYGCGYGALIPFLERTSDQFEYRGFDLSETMIADARARFGANPAYTFVGIADALLPADFTVASGVFNVKLEVDLETWQRYVVDTIDRLDGLSTVGFAFNMLTSYSDADKMRDDLYYGDPLFFFDNSKRRHAPNVALLHDYGLWEFTLLVRKELRG